MTTGLAALNPQHARMLAQLDAAKRALAEATTIDEARDIRDKAEAIRGYYQQQKDSLEAQNYAAELKLRAERKLGEMLKETPKQHGARPADMGLQSATPSSLSDLGIEKTQSHRWQKVASLPEAVFEEKIEETKQAGEELTTARMLRVAHDLDVQEKREEVAEQRRAAPCKALFRREAAQEFIARFEPESIDLLLTDPPYSTDIDDLDAFLDDWLRQALGLVADTGRALICTGAYPREMATYADWLLADDRLYLDSPLIWTYRNTLGPGPAHTFKLNYQIIWHLYGKNAPPLDSPLLCEQFSVIDIPAPDGRQGDRWHKWQKPEALAERLIRLCSSPGDIVVDPFAGTGTFGIVAAQFGRTAYGCDIDADALAVAVNRGGELLEG